MFLLYAARDRLPGSPGQSRPDDEAARLLVGDEEGDEFSAKLGRQRMLHEHGG
jgi:hypothetical protein